MRRKLFGEYWFSLHRHPSARPALQVQNRAYPVCVAGRHRA
ncbi:hypothetical protein I552_5389 [Mycobacterium xenopi 3993]|nr:hypothetical protein I552_5389 [Mycobacterium xenopi 3993]